MILVTGGAGFIGTHIVTALLDRGRAVRVLDRRDLPVDPRAERLVGDVRDADALRRALHGVRAVCHQAAKVGLGVDLGDVVDYVDHNDRGLAVLLRELAAGPPREVVLASSMVVYGEGRYRCVLHGPTSAPPRARADLAAGRWEPRCPVCRAPLEPEAVPEDAPADPRNVYAATKLHQEHLLGAYARETGARVVALRYHNVYGPGMPRGTPYAGVASIFASALAAGEAPRVLEDGGQRRDFVHVRDVARANVLALEGDVHGAFNVCSGTPRTILDLARALHRTAGPAAPAPRVVGGHRLGDVRHVFADPARARERLGFRAREPFEAGVAELAAELAAR